MRYNAIHGGHAGAINAVCVSKDSAAQVMDTLQDAPLFDRRLRLLPFMYPKRLPGYNWYDGWMAGKDPNLWLPRAMALTRPRDGSSIIWTRISHIC